MLSRLWSLFDQAGPLANFLQIAGACLAVGGVVAGLFRRRLRRSAHRIALLEQDVATREAQLAAVSEQRDRLARECAALVSRLPETAVGHSGDERAEQARIDDWIATEGRHIADILAKRADFIVRHAIGDGRSSALAMTRSLCEAALIFDGGRSDLTELAGEASATLALENRIAPPFGALIKDFKLFDVAERFDAEGVEAALAAFDAARAAKHIGHNGLAARLAHQALKTFSAQLGDAAAQTIDATLVSASIELESGRALACLDTASRLVDRLSIAPTHGPDHIQTRLARFLTTLSLHQLDRMEEALDVAREVVSHFPPKDMETPDAISASLHLVRCLTAVGQHDEAIELAREQRTVATASLPADHPVVADAKQAFVQALLDGDRLKLAEPALRALLDEAPFANSLKEASIRQGLAVCLLRLGRPNEAMPVARAAQDQAHALQLPPDDPLAAKIDITLADCFLQSGQTAEALRLAHNAVHELTINPSLGANHRSTLSARCVLARCLVADGREEDALREIDDIVARGGRAPLELRFLDAEALRAKLRPIAASHPQPIPEPWRLPQ